MGKINFWFDNFRRNWNSKVLGFQLKYLGKKRGRQLHDPDLLVQSKLPGIDTEIKHKIVWRATITRADGAVEDLGIVATTHGNPFIPDDPKDIEMT